MSLTILLYLDKFGDETSSFLSWMVIPQKGKVAINNNKYTLSHSGSFTDFLIYYRELKTSDIAKNLKPHNIEIVGILPGNHVTYLSLPIPASNRKKVLQAIPFLVEEFVIGDISELQIVSGEFTKENEVKVGIVEKSLINQWMDLFNKNSIKILKIYGLSDAIKNSNGEAVLFFFRGQAIFKSNEIFIQTDEDNLKIFFSAINLQNINLINIFLNKSEKKQVNTSRKLKIEVESEGDCRVEIFDHTGSVFDLDAPFFDGSFKNPINFIGKTPNYDISFFYNYAALLAAPVIFLALIQAALNLSSGFYFSKKSEVTLNQAKIHYQNLFKDDPIVDIKKQWEEKVKKTISSTQEKSFSLVFSALMTELLNQKNTNNAKFSLNEFRFDIENGSLRVNMKIDSVDILESLKEALNENSINFELLTATHESDQIKVLILVTPS